VSGLGARLRRVVGEASPARSAEEAAPSPPLADADADTDPTDGPEAQADRDAGRLSAALERLAAARARDPRRGAGASSGPSGSPPEARADERAAIRELTRDDPADALEGAPHPTEAGPAWVIDARYPLDHLHGDRPLGALLERTPEGLALLMGDEGLARFDPRRALFLDIEATGLDHGAGTLAFLIGFATFEGEGEGEALLLRQLVLREPDEEGAALRLLQEALDAHPFLVSFNGKSYDTTVLESRLIIHRLYSARESALKLRPHLDLLHLSRNLYRGVWEDTRLQTLEREALGLHRVGDIPGCLVPSCWFAWLQERDPTPLAAVARHNRDDVLSMVTLADRLLADSACARTSAAGSRAAAPPSSTHEVRLRVNLARLLVRRRAPARAAELLRAIGSEGLPPDVAEALLRASADCARRVRDRPWRQASLRGLTALAPDDGAAWSELALVLERAGQPEEALDAARAAERLAPSPRGARRVARLRARAGAHCPSPGQRLE